MIRDYYKQLFSNLVIAKPEYITVESLNIQELLEKSHTKVARDISRSNLGLLLYWIQWTCTKYGIELREAHPYYPSSQTCSCCDHVLKGKNKLGTKTIFKCPSCGLIMDRDENASKNLCYTTEYSIAS